MVLIDVHTHSKFSADGKGEISDMVATAKGKGLTVYGVSDHFDYDYRADGVTVFGKEIAYIDAQGYFARLLELQRQYSDGTFLLMVGAECGFSPTEKAVRDYAEMIERFQPDYVINSVHSIDGFDSYFGEYFEGKDKRTAYTRYLQRVRESLDAPYDYDVVAHLGYVSRNAPYPDKKLRYEDFPEQIDEILRTVIAKQKILEINSSARGAGSDFLPDRDILARYFQLGGREISYGSDAHDTDRIGDKFTQAVALLEELGFTHLTYAYRKQRVRVPL